ncbi:MAG: hypothetical protein P4L45_11875, partial [Ignavibacteriaceae bacterium]|nr:hypothetical protein [Ignavibacteriaceae bacterium]
RIITQSELFTKTFIAGDVQLENTETFFTKYPLLVPAICSIVSIWILGIYILKRLKIKLKL